MDGTIQLAEISSAPSPSELVARARDVARSAASRHAEIDALRDIPADIIDAMKAADLFRVFQPAAWGGFELDPRVVLDIQNALAETCMSTAWVYGVLCVQTFMLARFSPEAQADVWGSDPEMLASSSFQPSGSVKAVKGGFLLSGRWSFSSGSSHSGWALLGGMVPAVEAQEKPEVRLFLLPRKDYAILDNWQVIGLHGTGSNDIVVEEAFVPEYRTYRPDAGVLPLDSGTELAALYRLPWLYLFTSMISNLGIGGGRGAISAFVAIAGTRSSGLTGAAAKTTARVYAEIDAFEVLMKRNFGRLLAAVESKTPLPIAEALLYRSQLTAMMRSIAASVDELMLLSGGRGIRRDSPLSRFWLDLCAARAHAGNDPDPNLAQLAVESFGAR